MLQLSLPNILDQIAEQLKLPVNQIETVLRLLEAGNTIPFIARYRKEMTGELNENQLRDISQQYRVLQQLNQRKQDVLKRIEEQDIIKDELVMRQLLNQLQAAVSLTEVDDIYRPYRPKRKTRASIALERGLGPLTSWLKEPARLYEDEETIHTYAAKYISEEKGISEVEETIAGALDIFCEEVAENAYSRKWIRQVTLEQGVLRSIAVDDTLEGVYKPYYKFAELLTKIPSHRVMAINRGEREGILKVYLDAPVPLIQSYLLQHHVCQVLQGEMAQIKQSFIGELLEDAVVDAYKRFIAPALEREIRSELTTQAEEHAISIFGENLRHLLMQPPMQDKVILGVDPAYRTGCKLAVVDATGKMLTVGVIYPTPPQNKKDAARDEILRLFQAYPINLVVIGNGTASRETEAFIVDCLDTYQQISGTRIPYLIVSEAGASVYSASPLAGEEFPDLDVAERSAISIARRIQDPLAELVKIDPQSVGVGQYQHDIAEKKLHDALAVIVESTVNTVGVDVNTASPSLLSYVSGLNKNVAKNIVAYREAYGRFNNRKMLAKIPRLGPKTLEQCVGFLRIRDGEELLDMTPIHPESYDVVRALLVYTGVNEDTLQNSTARQKWITKLKSMSLVNLSRDTGIGLPTLKDIIEALEKPGRDPREDVPAPILRMDVFKLEDLQIGMELKGTVRNVVDFGAFIDVGLKNDGLVHISELSNHFVKHPMDVVSVGDIVQVRVIQIDLEKHRLGLSMRVEG